MAKRCQGASKVLFKAPSKGPLPSLTVPPVWRTPRRLGGWIHSGRYWMRCCFRGECEWGEREVWGAKEGREGRELRHYIQIRTAGAGGSAAEGRA